VSSADPTNTTATVDTMDTTETMETRHTIGATDTAEPTDTTDTTDTTDAPDEAASTAREPHALGPATAPVTLEMFGNYECLHCRRAHPSVMEIVAAAGDRVRLVYRHLARVADFPNSELAAEAAEAAGEQGQFWAMHELLMTGTPTLHRGVLLSAAEVLGLDLVRFRQALDSHVWRPAVRSDLALGLALGVRGTPAFFVNGDPVAKAWDLDELQAAVERALAAAAEST